MSTTHVPTGGVGMPGPTPTTSGGGARERDPTPQGIRGGGGGSHEQTLSGATGGGAGATTTHGSSSTGETPSMTEHVSKQLPQSAQEQGRHLAEQGRQTVEQGREMAAPYIEKGKELKDSLLHKASATSTQVQHQIHSASDAACDAWKDTKGFVWRHPFAILTLLSLGMMAGVSLTALGYTLGWMGKQMFGGHRQGSPQYEAHKALDTVLQSTYGGDSSWMSRYGITGGGGGGSGGFGDMGTLGSLGKIASLGLGGQQQGSWLPGSQQQQHSRAQDALHYMGDTWRSVKDRVAPDMHRGEQHPGGFSDFLGGLKERVTHPLGGSSTQQQWSNVEEAERRLREVLHSAAQRGER